MEHADFNRKIQGKHFWLDCWSRAFLGLSAAFLGNEGKRHQIGCPAYK